MSLSGEFQVFTEMHDRTEPVEGTLPISLDLAELIPGIEYCGHAVFLRSGLCDLCVNAKAKMVNIIPPTSFNNMPGDDSSPQTHLSMQHTLGSHFIGSNFMDIVFQTPPEEALFTAKIVSLLTTGCRS